MTPSPLKALIVYAHPEPTSFCGALKDAAVEALTAAGAVCQVSDLYGEQFNPVAGRHDFTSVADPTRFHYQTEQLHAARTNGFAPDLMREQARVAQADLYIWIFPLWWGGMPAILKGWFDRVLAYGFAYADGKRYESGYFRGRQGILAITTGGTEERFSFGGSYGDISQVLHGVQHCMLRYLGLEASAPFMAYAVPRLGEDQRKAYLEQWREQLTQLVQNHAASSSEAAPLPQLTDDAAGAWAGST